MISSSKYFFLIFISVLLSLFFVELLSFTQQMIIIPWTEFLASMSSGIVSFFDTNAISNGILLQDKISGFAVSIQPGCNGQSSLKVTNFKKTSANSMVEKTIYID